MSKPYSELRAPFGGFKDRGGVSDFWRTLAPDPALPCISKRASSDEDPAQPAATLMNALLQWPQYLVIPAGRIVRERFGIQTLPMCWFVDKRGVLRDLKGERDPEGITKMLLAE